MRLFSEELNVGSYETLLTLPVTFRDIILGKFFAAVMLVAVMLLPTIFYAVCITAIGSLDWGPVIGGYLGAITGTPASWAPAWWLAAYSLFVGLNIAGVETSFRFTVFVTVSSVVQRSRAATLRPLRASISRSSGASTMVKGP